MSEPTTISVDGKDVDVPKGATLLDAAARAGVTIPTMCYRSDLEPYTSCMLCLVADDGDSKLRPACSTRVETGMSIRTQTDAVCEARKTALELLLSEHVGDCNGPCQRFCPAGMNIPAMLRQIAEGHFSEALQTVKRHIALPAVLGRICPAPCEKGCRRAQHDGAVSICLLKRFVADQDLSCNAPWQPECKPSSGKQIAIVGSGPAGLAAAYELLQQGHACTIIDKEPFPGGRLRSEINPAQLPPEILDQEIALIGALGATFRMDTCVSGNIGMDELCSSYDAVILAMGALPEGTAKALGLTMAPRGIQVDEQTCVTSRAEVYACGGTVRPTHMAVRALADGRSAALAVDRALTSPEAKTPPPRFDSKIHDIQPSETTALASQAAQTHRTAPASGRAHGYAPADAMSEATRCLHCECGKAETCLLREHASTYQPSQRHYPVDQRIPVERIRHSGGVVYEPGKCIKCGICIRIAEREGEALGLTFIGRGFDIRVGVPFERDFENSLRQVAAMCAEACPTGALA